MRITNLPVVFINNYQRGEHSMKHRKILIGSCTVAAAMLSMGANAATRAEGVSACAQAAVERLGQEQEMAINYSLSPETTTSRIRLKSRELFHLDLRNPENDAIIARIDCVVDRAAKVRELKEVPIKGGDAIVRADS